MDRRPLTEIFVSALIAVACAVLLVQALALPPGISRSGMTIVAGMLLGLPGAIPADEL